MDVVIGMAAASTAAASTDTTAGMVAADTAVGTVVADMAATIMVAAGITTD
ncbi:MAG TPA: hypothetical protein VF410_08500 [Rhizomicrobium sp.]